MHQAKSLKIPEHGRTRVSMDMGINSPNYIPFERGEIRDRLHYDAVNDSYSELISSLDLLSVVQFKYLYSNNNSAKISITQIRNDTIILVYYYANTTNWGNSEQSGCFLWPNAAHRFCKYGHRISPIKMSTEITVILNVIYSNWEQLWKTNRKNRFYLLLRICNKNKVNKLFI